MTTQPPSPEGSAAAMSPRPPGVPLWMLILLGVAVIICGLIIIMRVAAPLLGLIAPPDAPIFPQSVLLERRNEQVGVDEYLYEVEESACTVLAWYEEQGGMCRMSPGASCGGTFLPPQGQVYSVGYCYGSQPFGDFAAHWEVWISAGYNSEDSVTHFLLAREIDWINQDD